MEDDDLEVRIRIADEDFREYLERENPSVGESALEALHIYRACRVSPPDWAINEISKCWSLYKEGSKENVFWLDENGKPAANPYYCKSLDDAFGLRERQKTRADLNDEFLARFVYFELKKLYHQENQSLTDDGAFGILAVRFGMSTGKLRELYKKYTDLGAPTISGRKKNKKTKS